MILCVHPRLGAALNPGELGGLLQRKRKWEGEEDLKMRVGGGRAWVDLIKTHCLRSGNK